MEFPILPADPWRALEDAFAWAHPQVPEVRAAYLEELARSFPSIVEELRSMLEDAPVDRFDSPDFHEDVVPEAVGPEARIGDRIGAFVVTDVIASGGMGDVLKAVRDDGAFQQVVAIKLLREGLQHGSFAERFLRERQTLAQLHHPNICGLLDGGDTEDGLPYLVMEFVEGLDLLQFAEQHRLTIPQRLHLAIRICDAVQYAHQHLVIHRDLKPGNILVDLEGHPALLDFGIAKLLDPEAAGEELTMAQFPVMTPAYASPEQVRGEVVGTASDIYSLGMVFYRLFGGAAPYDLDGLSRFDLAKTVSETPVAPLQQADKRFPQDLDAILAQCLRKEPQRRYASVHALAEDLERFQKGLPVQARADTLWYRTRRFLGRNRLPVSLAAVALLAGVIGLSAFIHSSRIAMRKALTTSRVSNFLVEFFSTPDPWATGLSEMSVQGFFDHGLERMFLDLEDEPEVRGELAATLGQVLLNLGDEAQAIQVLQQALDADPDLTRRTPALAADILFDLGVAQRRSGLLTEAEASLEQVLELRRGPFGEDSEEMASAWNTLGLVHHTMGAFETAGEEYRKALTIRIGLEGERAQSAASTLNNLGALAMVRDDLEDAVESFRRALDIHVEQYGEAGHPDLATTLNNLGMGLEAQGHLEQAETRFLESLKMRRSLLAADHPHIAGSLNNLGLLEEERGNYQEAANRFEQALAVIVAKAPVGHPLRLRIEDNLAAMQELLPD